MNIQENQRVMHKQKGGIGTVITIEETGVFIVQWDSGMQVTYQPKDQTSFIIVMGAHYQVMKREA